MRPRHVALRGHVEPLTDHVQEPPAAELSRRWSGGRLVAGLDDVVDGGFLIATNPRARRVVALHEDVTARVPGHGEAPIGEGSDARALAHRARVVDGPLVLQKASRSPSVRSSTRPLFRHTATQPELVAASETPVVPRAGADVILAAERRRWRERAACDLALAAVLPRDEEPVCPGRDRWLALAPWLAGAGHAARPCGAAVDAGEASPPGPRRARLFIERRWMSTPGCAAGVLSSSKTT